VLRFLLRKGVDINLLDREGKNILQIADSHKNIDLIYFLRENTSFDFPLNRPFKLFETLKLIEEHCRKFKIYPILYAYKTGSMSYPWNILCMDVLKYILKILFYSYDYNKLMIEYKTKAGFMKSFRRDKKLLWDKFKLTFDQKIKTKRGEAKIIGFAHSDDLDDLNEYLWFDVSEGRATYWDTIYDADSFQNSGFYVLD
jgi:hypothetical protein